MTRAAQVLIVASRYLAGAADRDVAEQQLSILLATDWKVPTEQVLLEVAMEWVRAEARAVAAERRYRTGAST